MLVDRPLSVAGRIIVKEKDEFVTKLVDVDRDLLMIPNLAIHMNREVNDGYKYNAQKDMLPLYGEGAAKDTFMKTIACAAGVDEEDILAHDLFLYNRIKGTIWGANEEFVSSSRLDDLQCAFEEYKNMILNAFEKYMEKDYFPKELSLTKVNLSFLQSHLNKESIVGFFLHQMKYKESIHNAKCKMRIEPTHI
mgnify:CR=1 FL=1